MLRRNSADAVGVSAKIASDAALAVLLTVSE
jgi:hypothetical protein